MSSGKVRIIDCKRTFAITATEYGPSGENLGEDQYVVDMSWQNTRVTGGLPEYWKTIIARGGDATTQLHAKKMTLHVTPMYVEWDSFGGYKTRITGPWQLYGQADMGMIEPPSDLEDEAQSRAEMEFVQQVRDARTKWEAGEFLGELGQTARFLAHPLRSLQGETVNAGKRISNIAAAMRKRDKHYKKDSDLLKRATDSYLAYQFGVKPIISDIQGAAEALQQVMNGRNSIEVMRLIGTGKAEGGTSVATACAGLGGIHPTPPIALNISDSRIATCRILGGYAVGLDRSPEMSFLDQFGVAPDNWVPTAYELFPWSHVVDYFTNVGSVLDAFALGSVRFAWLLQTDRFERKLRIDPMGPEFNPNGVGIGYGGRTQLHQKNVSRHARDNSFSPQFLVKKPSLSQGLKIAAMVNTIQALRANAGD